MAMPGKTFIVRQQNHANLDNLIETHPDVTTFLFEAGEYHITKPLVLDRENMIFAGMGRADQVHIYQDTESRDCLVIRADRVSVFQLSLHCEFGDGIALTHADVNWVSVEHCHIYGSEQYFAVYMAGKTMGAGQPTLDGYAAGTLDSYNTFDNNVVYSKWSGDAISFSLQKHGSVRNNIVRGGQFSIYMVRDCVVSNNHVYDSSSYGIGVSLPTHDTIITNNFIEQCKSSGIALRPQVEHMPGEFPKDSYNIVVSDNRIVNIDYIGIEITDVIDVVVRNNSIRRPEESAIYVLRSQNVLVDDCAMKFVKKGIFIDVESSEVSVTKNKVFSVYPDQAIFAVWLEAGTTNVSVDQNIFSGHFSNIVLKDLGNNNIIGQNSIKSFIETMLNVMVATQ